MTKNRDIILLFAFIVALLPVMLLRDFTPSNELRYLSIADEALREGHFFAFTNHGEAYADKPPLYLWLVMFGKQLFGRHIMLFLSMFSLIPALVILRTMDRWTREYLGERDRMTAMLLLMTSGLFLGLAVFVRMDMLMCMFITLALRSFWRMYTGTGQGTRDRILFPLYTWLALFTKGPVGLLVPILSVVVFLIIRRESGAIGHYCGWRTWGILAAGCAVWFTLVWFEGGPAYLNNLLFHQTFDRAVDAFHHKEPFWYYLVSVWYSLAPWSLLVLGVIVAALVRRDRFSSLELFFLTVIGTTLCMLSAFSSKLAVYLAPTFPFIVYLAALLMHRRPVSCWMRLSVVIPAVVWIGAAPILFLFRHYPDLAMVNSGWCMAAAGILSVTGIVAVVSMRRSRDIRRSVGTMAAGTLIAVFVGGMALPELNVRLGYGVLCREAAQLVHSKGLSTCYVWEMRRAESMDVYLGQPVVEVSAEELCSGMCRNGIVMLPERKLQDNDRMQRFLADKCCYSVGEYLIVELPDQNPQWRHDRPSPYKTGFHPASGETSRSAFAGACPRVEL